MLKFISLIADAIIHAENCTDLADGLKDLASGVMRLDPSEWGRTLREAIEHISDGVLAKYTEFKAQPDRKPYYIASGMEGTLLYVRKEIAAYPAADPRGTVAKLSDLSTRCSEAAVRTQPDTEIVRQVFEYCEKEYPGLFARYGLLTFVMPLIEIGRVAVCSVTREGLTLFVNACSDMLESFAYEAVALTAITEKVPERAIRLLAATTAPGAWSMQDWKLFEEYLYALKLGLSYHGPFSDQIELAGQSEENNKLWHEYVLQLSIQAPFIDAGL